MDEVRWYDPRGQWELRATTDRGIVHLGLDSEGTGREETNLLAGPARLTFAEAEAEATRWRLELAEWHGLLPSRTGGRMTWRICRDRDGFVFCLEWDGAGPVNEVSLTLPFDPLLAGTVLLPAGLDDRGRGLGPWLLVAPDHGHLRIEADSPYPWVSVAEGERGGAPCNAPAEGLDPRLRGEAWLAAAGLPEYRRGRIELRVLCESAPSAGTLLTLRFQPAELTIPDGIAPEEWQRIRRPYLNHWQPCGTWIGPELVSVLANNVLSDPASISLWFYAEPMLFWHAPVPGVDLRHLLRRSLDSWLDHGVSAQGHVNAFGRMYDLYLSTGACLLIAAWDYWTVSADRDWLRQRLVEGHFPVLRRLADYLLRRDVDGDGLIESYGSGNAGTLRDPDRADIWFEMMNFGWKNAWTNVLTYRALLCLAEMMTAVGLDEGARYYKQQATRLREAYVRQFLGRNGWFASWVSQDGAIHDHCHTFVNGLAVAYGLVSPAQGRQILERLVVRTREIGFSCWHLGVPANLTSCPVEDLIQPRLGPDGRPDLQTFGITDPSFWEEERFGYRYPNGTIHPPLVWPYLLGLQVAGLHEEADRLLEAMTGAAAEGLFQNGIVNTGFGGAEHFTVDGRTLGYEGYLPESFNFLMGAFTRRPELRRRLLGPVERLG